MIGFGIDQIQAEYVAEIKLRNINKEYILKRTQETDALQDEIDDLEDLLANPQRVKKVIVEELNAGRQKVRRAAADIASSMRHEIAPVCPGGGTDGGLPRLPCSCPGRAISRRSHPQSLRMSSEQKFKEGDGPPPEL